VAAPTAPTPITPTFTIPLLGDPRVPQLFGVLGYGWR
jgi:hypothetical protein